MLSIEVTRHGHKRSIFVNAGNRNIHFDCVETAVVTNNTFKLLNQFFIGLSFNKQHTISSFYLTVHNLLENQKDLSEENMVGLLNDISSLFKRTIEETDLSYAIDSFFTQRVELLPLYDFSVGYNMEKEKPYKTRNSLLGIVMLNVLLYPVCLGCTSLVKGLNFRCEPYLSSMVKETIELLDAPEILAVTYMNLCKHILSQIKNFKKDVSLEETHEICEAFMVLELTSFDSMTENSFLPWVDKKLAQWCVVIEENEALI